MQNQMNYSTNAIIGIYLSGCLAAALVLGNESLLGNNAVIASVMAFLLPQQKHSYFWIFAALGSFLFCQFVHVLTEPIFTLTPSLWLQMLSLMTLVIPLYFVSRQFKEAHQQQDVQVTELNNALQKSQRNLCASLEIVKVAADQLPAGLIYLNMKHEIIFHNSQSRCWLASQKEEINGQALKEIVGAERFRHYEPFFHNIEDDNSTFLFEEQVQKLNGQSCFSSTSIIPLVGSDQKMLGYLMHLEDITSLKQKEVAMQAINQELETESEEKKRAISALCESEQRYRSLFENNSLSVLSTNSQLRITNINKALIQMLGYTAQEFHTMTIDQVMVADDAREYENLVAKLARREMSTFNIEQKFIAKNGALLDVSVSVTALYDKEGNFYEAVAVIRDITQQKKTQEKLIAVNKELQQFASVASHDMKEPLRTISSFSELLARRINDDPSKKEFLNFIQDAAKRMSILLEDLITYARAGIETQETKSVDLNKVLQLVKNNLYTKINQTEAQIFNDPLPIIKAHATPFNQLFQNILANAIKFQKPECTPIINITATALHDEYLISISDNGIGMKRTDAEQIFEPFRRLHSRSEFEGSGIGLATCKKIIEQYNGAIWAESDKGVGTTFFITLPLSMIKSPLHIEQQQFA